MNRQTRVDRYRKLRDDISQMDTYKFDNPYQLEDNVDTGDIGMSEDILQTEHVKKNTLSISIDQIIKAHDEYTTMISQEDIRKKEKEGKKLQLRKLWSRIFLISSIVILISLLIVIIIILAQK